MNLRTFQNRVIRSFAYLTIVLKQSSAYLATKNIVLFNQELLLELFLFLENLFKTIIFKYDEFDDTFCSEAIPGVSLGQKLETIDILDLLSQGKFSGLGLP